MGKIAEIENITQSQYKDIFNEAKMIKNIDINIIKNKFNFTDKGAGLLLYNIEKQRNKGRKKSLVTNKNKTSEKLKLLKSVINKGYTNEQLEVILMCKTRRIQQLKALLKIESDIDKRFELEIFLDKYKEYRELISLGWYSEIKGYKHGLSRKAKKIIKNTKTDIKTLLNLPNIISMELKTVINGKPYPIRTITEIEDAIYRELNSVIKFGNKIELFNTLINERDTILLWNFYKNNY